MKERVERAEQNINIVEELGKPAVTVIVGVRPRVPQSDRGEFKPAVPEKSA